jgi:hypothetical protein
MSNSAILINHLGKSGQQTEKVKSQFTLLSDVSVPYQNLTPLRRTCVNGSI